MVRRNWNKLPSFIPLFRIALKNNLEEATEQTHDRMVRNWEKGMDATGKPWTPLSPTTVRRKGHSDPLIETETMIDSTGYEVSNDNLTAAIYVDDPKIAIHEDGTERIPARPVLKPASRYMEQEMGTMVGNAVDEAYVQSTKSGGLSMIVEGI